MRLRNLPLLLLALPCLSCSPPAEGNRPDQSTVTSGPAREALVGPVSTSKDIVPADLHARIAALSSDLFEGRAPGTASGEAAADWIAEDMKRIGLKPAFDGDWFQTVEMITQTVDADKSRLTVAGKGDDWTLTPGTDVVYWSRRQTAVPADFSGSDLVFVGYGVVAPEYGWDDYKNVDVRGKTVVMLVNDPGYANPDNGRFKGREMTYYGRWTYKFEEAARQGATAAVLIHDAGPAAYGWDVVTGSWTGAQADLAREGDGVDRVQLEAWISQEAARALFGRAGLDLDSFAAQAGRPGFKATALSGLSLNGHVEQTLTHGESRNVGGIVLGSERPDETVVYLAHWDHLGRKRIPRPDHETHDDIYNGAVDNATGVAAMLEIAEAFASGQQPKRSALFLAVTLEESGLLGSAYFAEHSPVDLDRMAAGVNLDGLLPVGLARDVTVTGMGASDLDDILAAVLAREDRLMSPDPHPEAGYYYRSDHISLAKKGVPMLFVSSGSDLAAGGRPAAAAAMADYVVNRYHKPGDEYDPNWNLEGMALDAQALHEVGDVVANRESWPNWRPNNEFRALRDRSMKKLTGP